jgi:hypothetical protein
MKNENCEDLIKQIVRNFCSSFENLQPLPLSRRDWIAAISDKQNVMQSACFFTRNVKFSIYTVVSRVRDSGMIQMLMAFARNVVSSYSDYVILPSHVSEFVHTFVNCEAAADAYGLHYHSDELAPPPHIIPVNIDATLRGFVCLNGCIAVNNQVL